jgi:inner membrane protein
VIGVLMLLMLIPLAFVRGTIRGRLEYKNEAADKVAKSWGSRLLIVAPVLNIPYTAKSDKEGKIEITKYKKYSPKFLDVQVNIAPQERYIGIFKFPVFVSEISMKGSFEKPKSQGIDEAFLTLEINNLQGISTPEFAWNGVKGSFEPSSQGTPFKLTLPNTSEFTTLPSYILGSKKYDYERDSRNPLKSLSAKVSFNNSDATFDIKFNIKGSQNISFVPIAKDNKFRIRSNWTNPNFSGSFLPDVKEINDKGFDAGWNINYLASGIPRRLDETDISSAMFTTSLLVPIDSYRSAERAVKYGILFIILTFLACFVFEIISQKPIHPFQYLLVGLAMSVFYILLLSICEFVPFYLSYFIAVAAIIIMISLYAKFAVSKTLSIKQTLTIAGALAALYGYLYILLQLEDMALIFGSIGLFVGLAIVMYATRNISWYEEK